jgi:2'-5' RNA ligase
MTHTDSIELMEAMAALDESFLLKHIWNRITTADLSKHTFENTRAALAKTVAGITDPEDIQALRKDRQMGRSQMMRMIERHPDPEQRAEAKRHLAWIEGEYVKMLSNRMAEIKAKHESGPLSEMTFDFTKMTGNGSTYACLAPASGETKRLLNLVVATRPPFDPNTLRDEAHVTLVYSREAQVDVAALDAGILGIKFPCVSARVVSVEYWEGHDKDGYAVLKLDSNQAAELNKAFQAAGAKHSFDDYQAHMTICGKVGPQTAEVSEWLQRINKYLDGNKFELCFDKVKVEDIKRD